MTIDLKTPLGRAKAFHHLFVVDHGFIRFFYRNLYTIAPGVYRSSQPSPLQVRRAARMGIRTIVNLRGASPRGFYHLQSEACAANGIRLEHLIVRSRTLPTAKTLHEARALFEAIEYPALFHCKSGADRSGFVSALYLLLHEGRPAEEAKSQLKWCYGHLSATRAGVLGAFFDSYIAERDAHGTGIWEWIDGGYDPDAIRRDFLASTLRFPKLETVWRRGLAKGRGVFQSI